MTPEEFIKQELGIDVYDENIHDDCDLNWDTVVSLMDRYRKLQAGEEDQ